MTRDVMRPASAGNHTPKNADDLDLLAGLWEEARFARLPFDAPSELRDLVEDIDNPRRVYAIHKASRRHNFQLLVQKYIVQLREGCGSDQCTNPTCFTFRKRIVGRAPIRRYNTTSARTLAIYLATQDNPEIGLCPTLRPPKAPPAALNSLVFVPTAKPRLRDERLPTSPKGQPMHSRPGSPKGVVRTGVHTPERNGRTMHGERTGEDKMTSRKEESQNQKQPQRAGFTVIEEPISKDHRSFAANVFGTVAFKMLEWLTPAAIDDMSRRTRGFRGESESDERDELAIKSESRSGASSRPRSREKTPASTPQPNGDIPDGRGPSGDGQPEGEARGSKDTQQQHDNHTSQRASNPRRNSNAKVRTSSGPKPKRQLSIDSYAQDPLTDSPYAELLRSPLATSASVEKASRVAKAGSSLPRPISQLSSAGFFDHVSLEKMPPPKTVDLKPRAGRQDGTRLSEASSPKELSSVSGASSDMSCSNGSTELTGQISESDDESVLPQALSRLDAGVIDFICDVVQEDSTAEKHMFEPQTVSKFHNRQAGQRKLHRRKRRSAQANVRMEWKLFVEQTFFYVLSDPKLALWSFTKKGQLYDSQTLWYCMLRMTRVAPSLVFQSLWMAAASLFAPPRRLQNLRSPTVKAFPKSEPSLSNLDAGRLMSICLHALIAAAPLVTDSQQLYDMSRIRSHGLSLAGSGAIARQPSELCLQYEDAFTDNLAMRLARRLFAAITTRRHFDQLTESNIDPDEHNGEDVLAPLFSQLDFLNMDAVYVLDFSFPDRAIHETRVPILLLDWARSVMLNDWDGSPEVPGDGPFGGALALIEAMYKRRQELLLADAQFRSDYFAERLDTIKMPLSWLSHTPTRQRLHLLDFPYIFNPSVLVSYFRSINFSRMSRAFEESTSLHDKITVIASRAGLTQHHKEVLAERLRIAGSKYLILDIRRGSVLEDAFDQLWRREERELLRPLKVHLGESTGEEGFDSGGVQQEFFRLALAEALNPDYGAFTVDERTRMAWFLPGSMEDDWKFELIGVLVSLAVYNGLTLPVTFPKALYRKLLGEPVTELHHIADGWPDLASGLTSLLEWDEKDGLVEDIFARTYEFSVSALGQNVMFIVQRNGEEEDPRGRLPTSYTCYGTLLLPEYKDREMLRERLGMALENAKGFGFA
ncbi:hypothetical protein N0V88_005221 [Collariella sp. IMI 366227]|nr:hypothetical protein N0V88_005221 [Collariella sp. IMI 366227]